MNVRSRLRIQPTDATFYSLVMEGGVQMKQRPRIYYTEAQKALMWDRWGKAILWKR